MALSKQDQDLKRLEVIITVLKELPQQGSLMGFQPANFTGPPVTVPEIIEYLETLALLMS